MKIYLIYSDSYKRINEKVNELINGFSNVLKFDLKVNSITDVIEEANYYSLTGEEKCIIVKSNDLFIAKKNKEEGKNKNEELLLKYIENPNSLVTLIFTSYEVPDKRKKIFKSVSNNYIELNPLNKKEMVYECINILKKNNININYEIGNYIVENSYVNYDICLSEIDKICLFFKKGNLSLEDIKKIVSVSYNVSAFKFVRCLMNKDINCTSLINDLEKLKIDPNVIIITFYKEMNFLYLLKTTDDVKKLCFTYGKEPWQLNDYNNIKDNYSLSEIKRIIIRLADYDYKYKSGLYDKSVILNIMALEFCN